MMRASTYMFTLIIALLVLLFSLAEFMKYYGDIKKIHRFEKGVDSFYLLYNRVEDVCRSFLGEKREIVFYLSPEITEVYSNGKMLCYDSKKDRVCKETTCIIENFNLQYMESPEYLAAAEEGVQKYRIIIEKVESKKVKLSYELII